MEIKLTGVDEALAKLSPGVYKKALNRTINDMGSRLKSTMTKDVRKTYNIKASEVKQFMDFKKSRYSNLTYVMDVRSSRFNAMRFGPKKLRQKGKMSVLIKKTNGRKTFKAGTFRAKNGALLQRYKNTQKVVGVKTVSIPQMFNKKILDDASKLIENEYGNKFKSNFDFYISKV